MGNGVLETALIAKANAERIPLCAPSNAEGVKLHLERTGTHRSVRNQGQMYALQSLCQGYQCQKSLLGRIYEGKAAVGYFRYNACYTKWYKLEKAALTKGKVMLKEVNKTFLPQAFDNSIYTKLQVFFFE